MSATLAVRLSVNGRAVTAEVEPRTHLADLLREALGLTGTRLGCEQGVCGACTVLVDGVPQRACLAFAVDCEGAEITTIEGFDDDPLMSGLREAFAAHHALQCGYCTAGMLITARDIIRRFGDLPERRLREELAGNICRCTGYVGIVAAIQAVAAGRAPEKVEAASAPVAAMPVAACTGASSPAAEPAAPALLSAAGGGVNSVSQSFRIAAPPDALWRLLADPRELAACLPGAEVTAFDGERLEGHVVVALGPIRARVAGAGRFARDEAAREGRLSGQGRDGGTGSAVEGEIRWRLRPDGEDSRLETELRWRVAGPLAQFTRGGLAQDVVRRLSTQFAANLEARLAGAAPAPARPLGLLGLLWGWLRARLGLSGR